jgi:hypothetical protein
MAVSPKSANLGATKLYRTACRAVILAGLALILAGLAPAQSAAGKKTIKGPRALGLVELAPGGKAHLVPITILYDGEYYDATAYKAAPVPMALESGTVYEGFRSGVSLGLFTVGSALQGNNTWVGNGTWQSDAEISAKKDAAAKRKAVMSKPAPELPEGPPVLRRASPKPKAPDDASSSTSPAAGPASPTPSNPASGTAPAASSPSPAPAETPAEEKDSNRPVLKRPTAASPQASSSPPPEAEEDSDRPVLKRPAATTDPAAVPNTAQASSTSAPSLPEPEEDPNRPVLKRGAPTPAELKKRNAATSSPPSPVTTKDTHKPSASPSAAASSPLQLIPAISDANGPEPRPYTYNVKREEEQKLRTKILALAADEVRAWAAQPESAGSQKAAQTPRPGSKAKPAQPTFEDIQLHVFDLSNSNEPVLVLTAKARMPVRPNTTSDVQYVITMVAREDIYGDLHKAFASVTDSQHFDVLSRLELIDAVDADGDGRGELLFRQVSDSGSAFVLYRVIGDRLWPLFQGTPGQ